MSRAQTTRGAAAKDIPAPSCPRRGDAPAGRACPPGTPNIAIRRRAAMSTIRYRILPHSEQPSFSLPELFGDLAVADICDALGRNAALPSAIKPLGAARLLGTAYTVNLPAGENLLLYYAVDNALPGDVLAVACDAYEDRAVCGEIMAALARKRGLAGFVVDGAVRDADALRAMDFPVYARAVSPNGPYKDGCGEINAPIAMGNAVIRPGDILVGDGDGLVAISRDEAEAVAERARALRDEGLRKLAAIGKTGKLNFNWLYEKLAASSCAILD